MKLNLGCCDALLPGFVNVDITPAPGVEVTDLTKRWPWPDEVAVPTTEGPGAWQDPTHVSFWNRRSFMYYEADNLYRERFARQYGIQAKFQIVQEHTDHTHDGPRLTIILEAVKP